MDTIIDSKIIEMIDLSVNIPNKTIIYDNSNNQSSAIDINLEFKNEGEIKEINYNSFIILPKELCFVDGVHMGEAANNIKELRLGKLNEDENVNVLHIDETWKYSTQVIANNDPMAIGAINWLKDNGYDTKKKLVAGIDATAGGCEAIRNGDLYMTVLQDTTKQGEAALESAVTLANGKSVSTLDGATEDLKYVWVPFVPITPQNIDQYIH